MANPFGFATFPYRAGSPNSEVVEALPFNTYEDWSSDWNNRRSALAAQARGPSSSQVRVDGFGGTPSWFGANVATFGGDANNQAGVAAAEQLANSYGLTLTNMGGGAQLGRSGDAFHYQTVNDAGYTPDFSALNAEKAKYQPMYENQISQQQAYNNMLGNNQANAVIGADYTNPNFGLVTGTNDTGMPNVEGQDWTSGVYDPTKQTGQYNPNMVNKTFWGL